jgi:hypothetical protein
VPDVPRVDVYVGGAAALRGLAYKADGGYAPVAAGTYAVRITPAGNDAQTLFGPKTLRLDAGLTYTAVAVGTAASKTVTTLLLTDDTAAPEHGRAKVRILHASPDAGSVDVGFNDQTVVAGMAFKQVSGRYLSLDPDVPYRVTLAAAGGSPLLGPVPVRLSVGRTYTLVVTGRAGDRSLGLQVYEDAPTTSTTTDASRSVGARQAPSPQG